MHALYCVNDHSTFFFAQRSFYHYKCEEHHIWLLHHHFTVSNLYPTEHQSWYQEMSRLKAKLESLQRSQRYKYCLLNHFIHTNNMTEIDYMTVAIHIQIGKSFWKNFRKQMVVLLPYCLIMHDHVKFLVSASILT